MTVGPAGLDLVSIAFYLPQYHPIPENDEWWGPGFTEWRNVVRARPRFPGHQQPHLPGELGFYDLRVPEVREAQAALARAHGIDAFCYYHYWFNGRRLLQRPLAEVMAGGQPSLPFCIAWANENWTRAWDGRDRQVLLAQEYSAEDDLAHIRSLEPLLTDSRYLQFDGKPLVVIYRLGRHPEPNRLADVWRAEAESWGLKGLHLARVESDPDEVGDPAKQGFDSSIEFQPRFHALPPGPRGHERIRRAAARVALDRGPLAHRVVKYDAVVRAALAAPHPDYLRWPGVAPAWDNSARRQRDGLVLLGSSPERYSAWVEATVRRFAVRAPRQEALLFVNAWNEWAEGAYLEPDARLGRGNLEAHAAAILRLREAGVLQ